MNYTLARQEDIVNNGHHWAGDLQRNLPKLDRGLRRIWSLSGREEDSKEELAVEPEALMERLEAHKEMVAPVAALARPARAHLLDQ